MISLPLTIVLAVLGAVAPPVTALAFAPDGKAVVVGSQAGLEVRAWPDLKTVRTLDTELAHVHDLTFSPDGKTLAAVGGTPAREGTVELYSWPGGKLARRFSPHRDLIYAADWRDDSSALATASADGTAGIHPSAADAPARTLEGHSRGILAVVFLPGNAGLVTASIDTTLRLWDVETGKPVRTLSNHTAAVHDLALRPGDGKGPPLIASASADRTVRLWQPTIGRLVRFARLESAPLAVVWTADGGAVVAACKDGRVRVIDPDTAEVRADRPALDGVAYSLAAAPDGSIVVGGQNGQIRRVGLKQGHDPR